jgi:hypothetical protein
MATFKVSNPEQFDFSKPEGWQKYIQRFERFRRASGLIDKDGTIQVNTLIYCMGLSKFALATMFWKRVDSTTL